MNKTELIEHIAKSADLSKAAAACRVGGWPAPVNRSEFGAGGMVNIGRTG